MSDIYAGSIVRVTTGDGFKNSLGALADPTTVTLRWRRHGDTEQVWAVTAGQIVRDGVGIYHADIQTVKPGLYYYEWEGAGAVTAVQGNTFSVTSEFVAP